MDHEILMRLIKWIELYEDTGLAGVVCRRCGISRPTLRKWLRRYEQFGLEGLAGKSRRPHTSPQQKVDEEKAEWILGLRRENNLGARRIQNELKRLHGFSLSLSTIQKVLVAHEVEPLRPPSQEEAGTTICQKDTRRACPDRYLQDCTWLIPIYGRR